MNCSIKYFILIIYSCSHLISNVYSYRDTTPNPNTKKPNFQFLWMHKKGPYVFCDLVVYPGPENRILFLENHRFAVQIKLPNKYDRNEEFLNYLSQVLWLKRCEMEIVKGKTKYYKRIKFIPSIKEQDFKYYHYIFERVQKEYISDKRCYQMDDPPKHIFPVSSTTCKYANVEQKTLRSINKKFDRIAMLT